jgi:hypothetical protein
MPDKDKMFQVKIYSPIEFLSPEPQLNCIPSAQLHVLQAGLIAKYVSSIAYSSNMAESIHQSECGVCHEVALSCPGIISSFCLESHLLYF